MKKQELNQEQRFEKKLKMRILLSFILLLLGILSISVILIAKYGLEVTMNDYMIGFYTGTGGGLVGAGIITIIKNIRWLKDEKKRRAVQLEEYDERNEYLRLRTMSISAYCMIFLLYGGTVITGMLNETVSKTLLITMFIYTFMILMIYLIVRKQN